MFAFHPAVAARRAPPLLVAVLAFSQILVGCSAGATGSASGQSTWQRIQAEKTITFGFANEPPYTIAVTDGVTGQDPETLKAIMKTYGVDTTIGVLVEFGGLIPGLLAKRFDVIGAGMSIRPARCEQIAFSNPILVVQQGLAVKAGNPLNLHSYEDIVANPKVKVAVEQGAVENEHLLTNHVPASQILAFPDNTSMFAALQQNRVDAVATEVPLMEGMLTALKDATIERVDPFEVPLDKDGKQIIGYVAEGFRLEDTDLRDAYNKTLAEMLANGQLLTIIGQYGFTKADLPPAGLTADQVCKGG